MKAMFSKYLVTVVAYFFMVLFCYAAVSKMLDFENFQVQLAQSPLLSAYAGFVSYGVIGLEFIICIFLASPKFRTFGLYFSLGLMISFTVYIYLILNYSEFVPCSCGGILEKMGWTEHLIFNVCCVILAFSALVFIEKEGSIPWRRTAALSSLILVISGGGMVALFLSSEYMMKRENNFTRRFSQHPIMKEKSYELNVNSYYFAGYTGDTLFLGNPTSPFLLTKVNTALDHTETIMAQPDSSVVFKNLQFRTIGRDYFLFDGSIPIIYSGKTNDPSGQIKVISYDDVYFDQLSVVDSCHFIIRSQSSKTKKLMLGSLEICNSAHVKFEAEFLKNRNEIIFNNDGNLITDEGRKVSYYVPYYHSEILIIGNDLKPVRTMKSIDGTVKSNIATKRLEDGSLKMKQPAVIVNRNTFVHRGILFNESMAMSQYEERKLWNHNSIIDVYLTNPAGYWGSFYIPKEGSKKMSHLMVTDQYLFVLAGTKIFRYRLEKTITDHFQQRDRRKPDIE